MSEKVTGGDLPFPFGGDNFWPWRQLIAALLTLAAKPADEAEACAVYQRMFALTDETANAASAVPKSKGGDSVNNG